MVLQERCLYVLFSRQNTKIGRFIRVFLRNSRYSHVTVALDDLLYAMYSFSRKRHDSPFSGCFMREYPSHFFVGGRDLQAKLCRVELDDAIRRLGTGHRVANARHDPDLRCGHVAGDQQQCRKGQRPAEVGKKGVHGLRVSG